MDFLSQIDYQLDFRGATDYLDFSDNHLLFVLSNRTVMSRLALQELGLYLTDSEWVEFDRRENVGRRALSVLSELLTPNELRAIEAEQPGASFGPVFAGVWQDQMDGGNLRLGVVTGSTVDEPALRALMVSPDDLEIILVQYSWDQLAAFQTELEFAARLQGVSIRSYTDPVSNTVVVLVAGDRFLSPPAVPSSAVTIRFNQDVEVHTAHTPSANHNSANQNPGLRIDIKYVPQGVGHYCTWGMTGHTATLNYLVTNGHCMLDLMTPRPNEIANFYNFDIQQGTTGGVELANQPTAYVVAKSFGLIDVARVQSAYGDTNCYHTSTSTCTSFMTGRRSLYDYHVGETICGAFGNSNIYQCFFVTIVDNGGNNNYRWMGFSYTGILGDSGTGLKYSSTWMGLYYGWSGSTGLFIPAYHVKTDLSFDLNCVPNGSQSGWGACPITP